MSDSDPQDPDMTHWSEAEFQERCIYFVKDHTLDEEPENQPENQDKTKAERSLPRNLVLKRCPDSAEVGYTESVKTTLSCIWGMCLKNES